MEKLVKKDNELADQLEMFFKRLSSACDQTTPTGRYFAHIAKNLSEQRTSFYASLAVKSYGQLETPCTNNLPYYIVRDKIINSVLLFVDDGRGAMANYQPALANFAPSAYIDQILDSERLASCYGIKIGEGTDRIIGKRHPVRIAQEAMSQAAKYKTNKLLDMALYALEIYIFIDTSIFEIYKRITDCYDELWGESDIMPPCDLLTICNQFDPYAKKANPEMDYRYKETQITSELILNVANFL